jgi:hypothetical protein
MLSVLIESVVFLFAYWIPGAALASLVEWKGTGKLTRWLAPFALSIVVTPVVLAFPSLVVSYKPNLWILGCISAALFIAGGVLARLGKRPVLDLRPRSGNPPSRREGILGTAFLILVAAMAVLPQLHLILNGSEVGTAVLSDTYWHVAEVTSIARSGLPPAHFLFPDLPLLYYFYSWIYPAVLGSLPTIGQSLTRILSIHAAINLSVFLGVLFFFLRMNLGSAKSRGFALVFLTLAGGFDFFVSPSLASHEWWQAHSPSLVSLVQIPSMLSTFMTEPQHLAGATAFLLLLILWRNLRGSLAVRGLLAAVAASFLFGTSAFVFFSAAVAALIWVWLHRRVLLRRRAIPVLAGIAALFLILSGAQIALSLSQSGAIRWGNFRVVIAEAATGTAYLRAVVLDQILTLAAFPVVASILLVIELGLPFVIYAVWFFRNLGRKTPLWHRFLAWYPVAYIPIAFLIQHTNFALRGMIPVEIVIVLAAAVAIEETRREAWSGVQRAVLLYGFTVLLMAQILSNGVEWWVVARKGLTEVLRPPNGILALPIPTANAFPDGYTDLISPMTGLGSGWNYLYWANAHLPADALVVEIGLAEDADKIHLLERMRFVDPAVAATAQHSERDLNIVNPQALDSWWQSLGSGTVWEKALRTEYVRRYHPPVYVLVHHGTLAQLGDPVYHDDYATIYLLPAGQ